MDQVITKVGSTCVIWVIFVTSSVHKQFNNEITLSQLPQALKPMGLKKQLTSLKINVEMAITDN